MARASGLDTAGSQVYITLAPQPSLDGNYVVFGSVVSGGDVVDALRRGDRIVSARVQAVP
jgi:cyclophilin family peptidyl-prolyl cis-trans isomerase